jgi:hypothetical protein
MKRKIIYVGLIAICFGIGVALWPDSSSKQVLADGTVLVLSGLKLGPTNVYTQGTWLSKTLGRFAPAKGITLLGVELRPSEKISFTAPEGTEVLSARILLEPGSPREGTLLFPEALQKFRWAIVGDDGKTSLRAFAGFRKQARGAWAYLHTGTFSRESRLLRIRLEERDKPEGLEWKTVAEFVVKNPKPARIESWTPQQSPRLRLSESLEMEAGELVFQSGSVHAAEPWEDVAFLPLRFFSNGQVATNWGIHGRDGGDVRDASGNFERLASIEVITNDWLICRIFQPLDPAKVWRFRINVARQSDFLATNLYSFTVPWPLATPIQTNLGGIPVRIGYVNTDMLNVEMVSKPADLRLSFVKAVDANGNDLAEWGGAWGQHSFSKDLKLSKPAQVHATVAIHPNYEVTFKLAPRDETAANRSDVFRPDAE